jgi:16S rRNA (cytidine1402-2'-O)-methyltransferase
MTTFFVVATPIGNLEDITLRALNVLKHVDVILCEDTRMTRRLLDRHTIGTRTLSYHAYSKLSRTTEVMQLLREGKNVALVSDAGTPGISDPGQALVAEIRERLKDELVAGTVKIESVPGASALTAAVSVAGVPCASFTFLGFVPHKKGRETLLKEVMASERTMVFYESPHRIMKTLQSLATESLTPNDAIALGQGQKVRLTKQVTVCRELTKIFEEVVNGSASDVLKYFETHPDKVRGEFVVIVSQK